MVINAYDLKQVGINFIMLFIEFAFFMLLYEWLRGLANGR
jgi:hypothetical protein